MFLSKLMSTRIEAFIADAVEEKLGRSELERPFIKMKIEGKTQSIELVIGRNLKDKTDNEFHPAQITGNETLFFINKDFINFILNTENKLRNKRLINITPNEVTSFEMSTKGNKLSMHKLENGRWEVLFFNNFKELSSRPGDDEIIMNFLNRLNTFQILSFVNDSPSLDDLILYGFNDSSSLINIVHENGSSIKVKLGNISTNPNGLYAQLNNEISVYACEETLKQILHYTAKFFRSRIIDRLPKYSTITSVQISILDDTSKNINVDNNSVKEFEKLIKSFSIKEFLEEKFSTSGAVFNGEEYPWRYSVLATVTNESSATKENNQIQYFFTEQIQGFGYLGGSPKYNATFTLNEITTSIIDKIVSPE